MEAADRNFLPKNARLFLKRDIDNLFENGQSFISYPLRVVYLSVAGENPPESGISALISVPKKRFKHAVDRNRVKRLIRETYRLNKSTTESFFKLNGKKSHIAFMYVCNDILPYTEIEKAMLKALNRVYRQENASK